MFFSKNHLKKQPLLNWLIPLLLGIVTSTGVFAQSDKTLQTPVQTVRPVVVDAIAAVVKANGEGSTMADAIAATASLNDTMYSVADGIANKLFVAYAAYTK